MPAPISLQNLEHAAAKAIDMAVLTRLTDVEVTRPPSIDLTPADPEAFWRESRVDDPRHVRIHDEWVPLEGRHWRALELEGESEGPGTHPGSRRLLATAHVRRHGAEEAPVVLLVHGFAIPFTGFDRWLAYRLRRLGASTIRIELPFHLRRSVPHRHSGDGFFSIDPAHTRAVVRQSVEDSAALLAWARREVSPRLSLLGTSLGGLVTTLLGSLVEVERLVAVAPLCDPPSTFTQRPLPPLQRRMGMLGEGDGYWGRDRAAAKAVLDAAMAPLVARNLHHATPGSRVTLIEPELDLIVGAAPIAELAEEWGAELWRYPHGHITVMNARGIGRRIIKRAAADKAREETLLEAV